MYQDIARINMVKSQIQPNSVHNINILNAISEVPKHQFLPDRKAGVAYVDAPLEVGHNRYLLRPDIFARALQSLGINSKSKVLDIACASGYSTAVLSLLAGHVIGVESIEELAVNASTKLVQLGYKNFSIKNGELRAGASEEAPFHMIIINGAVQEIPSFLYKQLHKGGKIAAIQQLNGVFRCIIYEYYHGNLTILESFYCHSLPFLF